MASDNQQENKNIVVFKTPPKTAFIMGIMVGITLTALTAFIMNYSLLKSNLSGNSNKNTNQGQVAGTNTNQAVTNTAPTSDPPHYDIAITADDHVKGDNNAKVTLVEYSDFQCPYCSRVKPTIDKILEDYKGKVKLIFRHFPLTSLHANAEKAAEASECASEQGKFWEMHDKLFENQTALTVDNLKQYAKDLGLNTSKFNQCLDSGQYAQKVQDDQTSGTQYGVNGTPAAFANGTLVSSWSSTYQEWQSGAQPYETFKKFIDDALNSK